jgi:tetratricopeptide (TPR) repeat protein
MSHRFTVALIAFSIALSATGLAQQRRLVDLRVVVRLSGSSLEPRGVLLRLQADQMPGGQSLTNTDSSGKATFANLPQAIYTVSAEFPGFISQAQTIDLQNTNGGYMQFELKRKPDEKAAAVAPEGPYAFVAANIDPKAQDKFREGKRKLEKNDVAGSIGAFKKAVQIDPKYTDAYLALGTAFLDTGDFKSAQATLLKAIEREPNLPGARFALGAAYNRTQSYPQAEEQLRAGLALKNDFADGHYELARTLLSTGRLPEGEEHVRKALALDPKHPRSHLLMGNVQLAKRDLPGAIASYREYLKLDPKGPMAEATKDMISKLEKELKKNQ